MDRWNSLLNMFVLIAFSVCLGCYQSSDVATDTNVSVETDVATTPTENDASMETSTETLIIDVRSAEEWDSGHLEQAIHIPHTEIAAQIESHATSKDANIALYCRSGGRAGVAKTALEELGYTNVENVGGYEDAQARFESK